MSDDQRAAVDPAQVRRDDRLALVALLCGIGLSFLGRRVPLELGAGLGVALGGVLFAIRGGRPIQARGWVTAALVLAVFALGCAAALELYEEWIAGQWFSEGPGSGDAGDQLRFLARTLGLLRIAGLAGGLSFLLGGLMTRFTETDPLGPTPPAKK